MTVLPDFDMLLFGGTGDLVTRKLLPALYRRFAAGQVSAVSRIFGVARSALTRSAYTSQAEAACREFLGKEFDAKQWLGFSRLLDYIKIDAGAEADFASLPAVFKDRDAVVRVFFFSTASNLFSMICQNLAKAKVVTPLSRVVLEKPLGHDTASANLINEQVGAVFAEKQIYRIDHYLGKEAVQNLMALRFGNLLFEPLWRRGFIKHVQITVAEELGVERRGNFYDKTGAMRDMVQNHLLQLLCIMAMEPPASSDPDAVRDEKLKVLRALRPLRERDVLTKSVRGQYKAGAVRGVPVPGYLQEADIAPDSGTETFVALKVDIDTWRWAGVPFYLRTGKRLQDRVTELVVTFEEVPHPIFEMPSSHVANELVIRLQPDESITMTILAKNPGEGMRLKPVNLALDLGETFKMRSLDAYERLLMDTVKGNLTLFMRRDELDAAWAWIDPIRAGWEEYEDEGPKIYIAGTWGPASSSAMLSRDGYAWHGEL